MSATGLLYRLLAPAGARGRLVVLIFHRVLPEPDALRPGEPDLVEFRRQMHFWARHFQVLPLLEAAQRLAEGRLPAAAACITFDDGYADNLDVATPVLQALGLPATLFVASGFLDGGVMWNDLVIEALRQAPGTALDLTALDLGMLHLNAPGGRAAAAAELLQRIKRQPLAQRAALAEAVLAASGGVRPTLMLSTAQLRRMAGLDWEIGAHTVRHPILDVLPDAQARQEIRDSKQYLEQLLGQPVRSFAYPNGRPGQDYAERHVAMVREAGFSVAVSTRLAVARSGDDVLQLPRFTPWDRQPLAYAARVARALL